MAAAWPHCDAVVSAHTLAALDQLAVALADPVRRRAPVRLRLRPPPTAAGAGVTLARCRTGSARAAVSWPRAWTVCALTTASQCGHAAAMPPASG